MAARHRDFDDRILQAVLSQDDALVSACATPESRSLHNMHSCVSRSLCKAEGFTRLEVSGNTLYGRVELEHDIMDLLLSHFHRRYPGYDVALGQGNETFVMDAYGRVRVCKCGIDRYLIENGIPNAAEPDSDQLFETYYLSQCIKERRNVGLMRKMMPRKHSRLNHIEHMLNNAGARITDF